MKPKPRFLHGIVRLAERAQPSMRDGPQVRAVPLEAFDHPVVVLHRPHPLHAVCTSADLRAGDDVTVTM